MKSTLRRAFGTAFFSTLLLCGTLFGLLCVGRVSEQGGMALPLSEVSAVREEPLALTVTLGGTRYTFDLTGLETAARAVKEHGTVLIPRKIRFAVQWGRASALRLLQEAPEQPKGDFINAALV